MKKNESLFGMPEKIYTELKKLNVTEKAKVAKTILQMIEDELSTPSI
jgi:DeoR/GlpR family transcriptional regulator of sugar metabolism